MNKKVTQHQPKHSDIISIDVFKEIISLPLRIIFYTCGILITGLSLSKIVNNLQPSDILWVAGFYLSAFLIIIITHELGHIVALHLVRFKLSMLVVGPVIVWINGNHIYLKWNFTRPFAGFTMAVPKDVNNLGKRLLSGIIGGPAAGFLLTLITFTGFMLIEKDRSILNAWFLTTSGYALLLTTYNLLPISNSNISTDGAKIWAMLHHTREAKHLCACYHLLGENFSGIRPSQWNTQQIAVLLDPQATQIYQGQGHLFAYLNALDLNDIDRAKYHLEISLATRHITAILPVVIELEAVYFYAAILKNGNEAQKWNQKTKHLHFAEKQANARAQAALFLVQNQLQPALDQINIAMQMIHTAPVTGLHIAEKEWLKNLKASVVDS